MPRSISLVGIAPLDGVAKEWGLCEIGRHGYQGHAATAILALPSYRDQTNKYSIFNRQSERDVVNMESLQYCTLYFHLPINPSAVLRRDRRRGCDCDVSVTGHWATGLQRPSLLFHCNFQAHIH